MTHKFTVSDLGLRLIKAYEGYRGQSRAMETGPNVVGYGHRLADQDAIELTREEADVLLREDILPVEDLVNEAVFAPLTQGQFDALCSLAYNIGADAFMKSGVLKAINNGRPIEAANGFDVWRKGRVGGQSYIIDALVRRRTAEKALFLKPEYRSVTSPRDSLPPQADGSVTGRGLAVDEVFTVDETTYSDIRFNESGYGDIGSNDLAPEEFSAEQIDQDEMSSDNLETPEYELRHTDGRRREDGPAGILELSEYIDEDSQDVTSSLGFVPEVESEAEQQIEKDVVDVPTPSVDVSKRTALASEVPMTLSPIAEAAADVSSRLDALIDGSSGDESDVSAQADSVVSGSESEDGSVVLPFVGSDDNSDDTVETEVISETVEETYSENEQGRDSAARFIQAKGLETTSKGSVLAYIIMLLSGLVMTGLSFFTWNNDPEAILGAIGPVAALAGIIVGGLIVLGSVWYIFKSRQQKN